MSCCSGQPLGHLGPELADCGYGRLRAELAGDITYVADAAGGAEPAGEVQGVPPGEPGLLGRRSCDGDTLPCVLGPRPTCPNPSRAGQVAGWPGHVAGVAARGG
jgi:hypothetical protein